MMLEKLLALIDEYEASCVADQPIRSTNAAHAVAEYAAQFRDRLRIVRGR